VEHPETNKRLHPDKPNDLLFAEIESAVISQAYPSPTRIAGRNASRVRVIEALKSSANLFHFTGHGYHDVEEPLKSALALAGEDVLTLHDIFKLRSLDYYLVCLSACETGITNKQGLIDEFVGLVSGFLAVGVTYIVSTLWTVDEISTALIMIRFYQLLKDIAPAQALKQAQHWLSTITYPQLAQWYLNLATPFADSDLGCWQNLQSLSRKAQKQADRMGASYCPYEHPYYWAGFTITGKVL
jgi:CHAT domain-containing protein